MSTPVWRCVGCGHEEPFRELYACPRCGGELTLEFDCEDLLCDRSRREAWGRGGTLWERFAPLLPPVDRRAVVTLGEGGTPLVPAPRLAKHLGLSHLYLKLEQCNPTGSFKDRQIAVAFCKALEWGHRAFGIASSGNAGVSLAAFCARAGCVANVWASRGAPPSKLCQIQVYGARLFLLPDPEATGDMTRYYAAYTGMRTFCAEHGLVPMITARRVNPL
ncbi:MAG: threonine synthase, partial [Candidatus Zipacnadales bacterium]